MSGQGAGETDIIKSSVEVFALAVTLTVAVESVCVLCARINAPMPKDAYASATDAVRAGNICGALASLISCFLCLWGLSIWFEGLPGSISCTTVQIVNGTLLGSSNVLVLGLLLCLAEASSKGRELRGWRIWRRLCAAAIAAFW
jgi:hypothetical protein